MHERQAMRIVIPSNGLIDPSVCEIGADRCINISRSHQSRALTNKVDFANRRITELAALSGSLRAVETR